MLDFVLIREITIGDILTFLSIIISVTALLNVWMKERQIRNKEQADKIRTAAAKTLAKLERLKELSLWYYQDIQPIFVETSEMLTEKFDVIVARDFLWKMLNITRKNTAQRILDEEIEIAYVELYGYYPAIYDKFVSTIEIFKNEEEIAFKDLILTTQKDILSFKDHRGEYETAMLGNALRESCNINCESFQKKIEKTLKPIHEILVDLISKSDEDILKRKISEEIKA